jgi:hypothetical protein
LSQKVDDVASEIERFVLKVVASAGFQVVLRRKASGETIALASSHVAQEFAFLAWFSVSYADEFGPALDVGGRARGDHENYRNQRRDLHIGVINFTQIRLGALPESSIFEFSRLQDWKQQKF